MSNGGSTNHGKTSSAIAGGGKPVTVGVDLGDRKCHICVVDSEGEIVKEEAITTSPTAFKDYFKRLPRATVVAIGVGPHSRWVSQVIRDCGHDAIVANASKVKFIFANNGKNDRVDARSLARLARLEIVVSDSSPEQRSAIRSISSSGTRCARACQDQAYQLCSRAGKANWGPSLGGERRLFSASGGNTDSN